MKKAPLHKKKKGLKKSPPGNTSASKINKPIEGSCDKISLDICKAIGWPCEEIIFSERGDLHQKSSQARTKRPSPSADNIGIAAGAKDMHIELTNDKGSTLRIGRSQVSRLRTWDIFGA